MVDTAVFSIFHRPAAPVARSAEIGAAEQPIEHLPSGLEDAPPAPAPLAVHPETPIAGPHELAPEPHAGLDGDARQASDEADSAVVTSASAAPAVDQMSWTGVPASHDFITLADPAFWSVVACYNSAEGIEVHAEPTGLYRPTSFRPAPWSGFAYDVAPDRKTGLVAGTKILTARGEVAVEDLLPGDTALALRGPALLPILWIGRCLAAESPVLIEAGALGEQRPNRPLCVAADHPIFVDPVPVPAKRLVNGTTIHTVPSASAELFHVDVGRQEVLFAQNVPLASTLRGADGAAA